VSTAGYVPRAFIANLLFLPPRRLYRVFFDRDLWRNNQLQIGDCRFWGPEEFTAICQSAMDELRVADAKLFAKLTSGGTITFWLKSPSLKRRVYDKVARFYSIDPVYYAWGALESSHSSSLSTLMRHTLRASSAFPSRHRPREAHTRERSSSGLLHATIPQNWSSHFRRIRLTKRSSQPLAALMMRLDFTKKFKDSATLAPANGG
jgi:hypothetical protein